MACQKDEYQSLAERFRAIIFLATPHRGADIAQSLSRVLSLSPGARPYVRDLHRNSLATQSINDEFPRYAEHLQLFSSYETLPMTHGIGKGLIVEKDAAVLSYANETATNHAELVPLLCKFIDSRSARILLTSRTRYDFYRRSVHIKVHIVSEAIPLADTQSDIALYLDTNLLELPVIDEGARKENVDVVLAKSAGCFLWVDLTLKELRQAHTLTEIRHVLEEVPSDMTDLYSRIMDQMSKASSYSKRLAKSILTWIVCAARQLTTSELGHALEIDLNDKSRVQRIHQTARDFLVDVDEGSEFAVDRKGGHGRILKTCLEYLNGSEIKGLRHRRSSATALNNGLGPFAKYACTSFYARVLQVSSQDDETLIHLAKFFASRNVLAWVEYLASASDLTHIRAAKALSNFLQRRSKYASPVGRDTSLLESWAIDLVRLVTKFGKKMTDSPSSIHHLIPPFCPSGTAIHKSFWTSDRGLCIVGLSSTA
ncbi:MAG: hypothetical protein Q9183_002616 [Haloplaca sp. 2 TL-2023]